MIRFIIFVFVFAFILAIIFLIIGYVFRNMLFKTKKAINNTEDDYIKIKFNNNRCRWTLDSHNFSVLKNPNTKCKWCGKTLTEVKEEIKKYEKFK